MENLNYKLNQLNFFKIIINKKYKRLICVIVLMTLFNIMPVGYHIIALNVPIKTIHNAIRTNLKNLYNFEISQNALDILWSFIVSCQSIGAFASCFIITPLKKQFGTKHTLIFFNNILLFAASAAFFLTLLQLNIALLLIVGRLLIGLYTGIGCALVPIFIHELSPTQLKGALSCFVHISVCLGSSLGAFLSCKSFLGNSFTWNFLLIVPAIFGIMQVLLTHYFPNTPGYYLSKNNMKKASESLKFYYLLENKSNNEEAFKEYNTIVSQIPTQITFKKLLQKPDIMHGIFLGLIVSVAQVFSGSMATVAYSTSMFDSVLIDSTLTQWIPTIGSLFSVFLSFASLQFVQTCDRKQLFINTLVLCAASTLLLALFSILSPILKESGRTFISVSFILVIFIFGSAYNIGVGPVGYFLPAELVNVEAISIAMGSSVAVNWLATMFTTLFYYPFNEKFGGWSYFMFIIPTIFFSFYLNEKLPSKINDLNINYDYFNNNTIIDWLNSKLYINYFKLKNILSKWKKSFQKNYSKNNSTQSLYKTFDNI